MSNLRKRPSLDIPTALVSSSSMSSCCWLRSSCGSLALPPPLPLLADGGSSLLPTWLGWETWRSLEALLGAVAAAGPAPAGSPGAAAAGGSWATWAAAVAVRVSSRWGSGGVLCGAAAETAGWGRDKGRPGSSSAVALESQMTLRRKKRCSVVVLVAAAPRLSLSMVWRRRRYSSVRPVPASGPALPSFSPTEESELEPFLGEGAGGERNRELGVLLCFSEAPPDMVGPLERGERARTREGREGEGPNPRSGGSVRGPAATAAAAGGFGSTRTAGSSLSTDEPPRRRRGPLDPVAAAAAAAVHEAGSSAGDRGAEPRGLAPHGPHPSCGERRPGRLEPRRRRSHEGQGKGPAPSRSGCGGCGGGSSSPPPPPPLPELGGLGPGGGGNARNGRARTPRRWQPHGRPEWEGPRKAREGRPGGSRSISQSVASSQARPQLGGPVSQSAHRPDGKGRSLEASVPEERAPPSPRPPRPPRAWQTLVSSRAGAGG